MASGCHELPVALATLEPAGENLHDGGPAGVAVALDYVVFEFAGNEKIEAGQFFAQGGQRRTHLARAHVDDRDFGAGAG